MSEKILCLALSALLFALRDPVEAQQPKKVYRIGYLSPIDPALESTRSEPIRLALRELGYIEGQNIVIEYRYSEGKLDRSTELAFACLGEGHISVGYSKCGNSCQGCIFHFDVSPWFF
jgi:hypothetical protein